MLYTHDDWPVALPGLVIDQGIDEPLTSAQPTKGERKEHKVGALNVKMTSAAASKTFGGDAGPAVVANDWKRGFVVDS